MPAISRPPGTTPSSRTIARGVKRTKRRADRAASTCAAFEMRATGASLQQVANALFKGDKSNAHRSIQSEIRARGVDAETVAEVLTIELARLDVMFLGLYDAASSGDVPSVLAALKIQDRRTAYLGIDAPKPTAADLSPPTPVRVEFVFVEDDHGQEAPKGEGPAQTEPPPLDEPG